MKKYLVAVGFISLVTACNNNKSDKAKVDTTPVLSQTNNNYPAGIDTLGYHKDSASSKYEKGSNLITSSDCLTCHRIKEKNIGPAYVAVAEKYPATPQNIQYLTSKIIKGGKGVWGEVQMTPHPAISQADATTMVNYILSLKGLK